MTSTFQIQLAKADLDSGVLTEYSLDLLRFALRDLYFRVFSFT